MSVNIYKNFDIQKIRFNDTVKRRVQETHQITVHSIDTFYNNAPIFIQLDKCICSGIDENNCLILQVPKAVEDFVRGLEEYIIDKVYDNSERWFNGRRFTLGKIQNGLISCLKSRNLIITLSDNNCFFNQYKKRLSVDEVSFPIECICIVRLCCLQFIGNRFTYKISAEQCKVNIEYKLVEYSILDDSRDDSSIPITETQSDKSYREYPEYYGSEVDSEEDEFFK